jgi:UDP-N-acetylmuramoyl-L-alanyl-D-glutamate--2,6-diaminopimelate ligase
MRLYTLLSSAFGPADYSTLPDLEITGISEDSRKIGPGNLFVARGGAKADGRRFVADAAAHGAAAVVAAEIIPDAPIPQWVVADTRSAASRLAQVFYDAPSARIKVLGITGTNGKTTTTYLLRDLLASVGLKCGLIGTVQIDDGASRVQAAMTTPGGIEVARLISAMGDNGCAACAIEVSSHALDQGRVAGVKFAGAAFTNLTGDHLDYHGTMENYSAAKARLFASLASDRVAVVNADDLWSGRMLAGCAARAVRFGFSESADYRARDVSVTSEGSRFVLVGRDGEAQVITRLIGRHNIANALTAAALAAEVFGLTVHQIAAGLKNAAGAPGRLQPVQAGQEFGVFVDYAHTDDGLENVLSALRPLTRGKLRVVFGCGGDRDRTKRPRMARVAERLADVIYLTSDNPRTENPVRIIEEIISGFSADVVMSGTEAGYRGTTRGKAAIVEQDRRRAIQRAMADAVRGDVVLLAGKGHEKDQIVGNQKLHFDDVEEATSALGLVKVL